MGPIRHNTFSKQMRSWKLPCRSPEPTGEGEREGERGRERERAGKIDHMHEMVTCTVESLKNRHLIFVHYREVVLV